MAILTYVNLLPIPWRVAILIDACGDLIHPDREVGLDFYGRPTEALWFHLPRYDRAKISLLLNCGYAAHIASFVSALYFWEYIETQIWPGAFAINLPGGLSILSIIAAGVLQGKAEVKLIEAQPQRFPPAASKYFWEAVAEWRSPEVDRTS